MMGAAASQHSGPAASRLTMGAGASQHSAPASSRLMMGAAASQHSAPASSLNHLVDSASFEISPYCLQQRLDGHCGLPCAAHPQHRLMARVQNLAVQSGGGRAQASAH